MKKIGIDASRAFLKNRTGIEEYAYQVIKKLREELNSAEVFLYVRKNQMIDFELPKNWKIKIIKWPFFWTQVGLSLEMLLFPVDALFVPAHTVPLFHPKNTIVTIHGLEYEFCPKAYSVFARFYMRLTIKKSCQWASRIISVSENTKKDLMKLYKVPAEKIEVVYEGYTNNFKFQILNFKLNQNEKNYKIEKLEFHSKFKIQNSKFLLFLGRIEERKNVGKIVEAFEILKEKYAIEHQLVLAGKAGYGFEKIQNKIQTSRYNNQIILTGFVSEQEKWELLQKAQVFVFPTQYEGFGIPVLEAQSVGCPVVASNNSSIIEVVACHSGLDLESSSRAQILKQVQDDKSLGNTCSAPLVDPSSATEIAEAIFKIISDEKLKKDLVAKGLENVQRFSWEKCGREVAGLLN